MELTHRWLERCYKRFKETAPLYGYEQTLFPIVQGSTYKDLRVKSAETVANFADIGIAIGGLSVGEPAEDMYEMTELVCNVLPEDKPRYLMGVGKPLDVLNGIKAGLDMFVIENSYIGHLNQKSSPQNNHYIFLRKFHRTYSSLYLKKKHTSSFKAFRLALAGTLKGAIALLLKRGSKIEQRARILASWHFVLGRGAFDAQDKAYYT
jgi:hypothetical protein